MKRFTSIILICSMLVSQPISAWSWGDFARGACWTALGTLGLNALPAIPAFLFGTQDDELQSIKDSVSFNVGESATGYIGSSLAGFAAIKCLNNPDIAQRMFGYNSTSAFAGVLTSSTLFWLYTHGASLIKFLRNNSISNRQQAPEWQWEACAQGAGDTLYGTGRSSLEAGVWGLLFFPQNSFKENLGYALGTQSCSAMRTSCTGLAAASLLGRPDVAKRMYGSDSPAYFAGRLGVSAMMALYMAVLGIQNYGVGASMPSAVPTQTHTSTSRLGYIPMSCFR